MAVGDRVCGDRFEITQRLADGGTAVTFAARDRCLGQEIAIKIAREPGVVDRTLFLDQFWKITRLRSAYLAVLLGYFEHAIDSRRFPIIALELVEGVSLSTYLATATGLQSLEIARQLALALDDVDQSGMKHGDVTGANVMVRDETPVLIDPDSAGRDSGGGHGEDYLAFVRVVARSKVASEFPVIVATLTKVDRQHRPFRAAAEILRSERPSFLLQEPTERLKSLGGRYRQRTADAQAAFSKLVQRRRTAFTQLVLRITKACSEVGLVTPEVDADAEQTDAAAELNCLERADGVATLQPASRRYSAANGMAWMLVLEGAPDFTLPSPYEETVCAEITCRITGRDRADAVLDKLRICSEQESFVLYRQCPTGWVALHDDSEWLVRSIEVMVEVRIPSFATERTFGGDKVDPTNLSLEDRVPQVEDPNDEARTADVPSGIGLLQGRIGVDVANDSEDRTLAALMKRLLRTKRSDWHSQLQGVVAEFAIRWGRYFSCLERYELVEVEGRWYLELVGNLADPGCTRVEWQFRTDYLDISRTDEGGRDE